MRLLLWLIPVLGVLSAGCSSRQTVLPPPPAALPAATIATARMAPPAPEPFAAPAADAGAPVWRNPRIVKVQLRAYQDEKGRLFGPQTMYEMVEFGGWNVEALDQPEMAYIPPENLITPPGIGSPFSAMALREAAADRRAGRPPVAFFEPREVMLTGLLAEEPNREQAQRMAEAAGKVAKYDADLGWLLVPKAPGQGARPARSFSLTTGPSAALPAPAPEAMPAAAPGAPVPAATPFTP